MTDTIAPPPPHAYPRFLAVAAVTLVASVGAFLGVRSFTNTDAAPSLAPGDIKESVTPSAPDIEAKYGVRFVRIGMTADDGLIDVRFQILDAAKAGPVLGHHAQVKMLLANERTRKVLDTRAFTPGDSNVLGGEGSYVLFRNAAGTIRRGDYVDIFLGDLHIDHFRVL